MSQDLDNTKGEDDPSTKQLLSFVKNMISYEVQ